MTVVAPETRTAAVEAGEATDEDTDCELVLADLLVEEISIDGMCGVY
jgi:mycofactocin precursor